MKPSSANRSAFTIIELLVVVVMVAFFGTLLLPALALDQRTHTAAIRCLANHSELIKAWQMYATDSDDYVANNYTLPGTLAAVSKWSTNGIPDCWAPNMMTFSTDQGSATNVALAKAGQFGPYHQSVNVYHCPSDTFISPAQRAAGWKNRIRSISMNSNWGRSDPSEARTGIPTSWGYGGGFRQWHRLADVQKPAHRYVFLDEHSGSINDGFFIVTFGANPSGQYPGTSRGAQWGDVPGFYHRNSTPFGFADGHTEMRTWFSRNIPVKANGDFNTGVADLRDQQWYVQHVAERL